MKREQNYRHVTMPLSGKSTNRGAADYGKCAKSNEWVAPTLYVGATHRIE